jgi:hypothetical protein
MGLKNYLNYLLVVLVCLVIFSSCRKEINESKSIALANSSAEYATATPDNKPLGVYLLYNDVSLDLCKKCGTYGGDRLAAYSYNADLSFFNFSTKKVTTGAFPLTSYNSGISIQNSRIYGSKMYVIYGYYTNSPQYKIEVVNIATKSFIKQIQLTANGVSLVPTDIAFYKNYALITTSQKLLLVIDTATMTITHYIKMQDQGASMSITNGKLFILCSDAAVINVYDLATAKFVKTIVVTSNLYKMGVDGNGNIYVLAFGELDFGEQGTYVIDSKTYQQLHFYPNSYYNMWVSNNDIYYLTEENKIQVYDTKSYNLISPDMLAAYPAIGQPYDVHVDNTTGDIFVYSIVTNYLLSDGFSVAYINNTGKTLTSISVFDKNYNLIYTSGLVINPILDFIN